MLGDDRGGVAYAELGPVKVPRRSDGRIIQPTGDRRHITGIREGRISFESFSRANREKIPVDHDVETVVAVKSAKAEVVPVKVKVTDEKPVSTAKARKRQVTKKKSV